MSRDSVRERAHASAPGSLKSRQISPQEFLSELKSGATDERLFACLDSLRVSLTSNPVSTPFGVWERSVRERGRLSDPQSVSKASLVLRVWR
ncbi:protein diaphanous homolog 3 isoform X1 [Tachysurus ichikawai]